MEEKEAYVVLSCQGGYEANGRDTQFWPIAVCLDEQVAKDLVDGYMLARTEDDKKFPELTFQYEDVALVGPECTTSSSQS